jgi:hypothetical protein
MKKETLEEAAEKEFPLLELTIHSSDKYVEEENLQLLGHRRSFIKGAKWQAERMYSEADNIMRFLDTEVELKLSDTKTIERIKWYFETYFEQFKKK